MSKVVTIIIAAVLAILGIIVLIGKGDTLIAGYNTASPEEKSKVNIKRLRLLVGSLLIGVGLIYLFMTYIKATPELSLIFAVIIVILAFIVVFLANTWAKK